MNNALKKFKLDIAFYFAELLNKPLVTPHHVYLDLTHNCTHNCRMCGVIHILKRKVMPTEYAKKVIDEIKSWGKENTVLTLTGGEPLTHKDIFKVISYATSAGIRTELITNGFLVTPIVAEKLAKSGLENIAVSIEGSTAKTHDTITRVKSSFERTTNAVKMLLAAKKKKGSGPQISVWMTIMDENVHEIYAVAELSKKLGVECLVYHPVIVNPTNMQNTTGHGSLWLNTEKIPMLKSEIKRIITYKEKHGMIAFLHNPELFVNYFEGSVVSREWKCNPFEFLSIGPDGNMQVCGDSFGNISKSSIMGAMKNEKAIEVRQRMKLCTKNCLQTCWARPDADSIQKIVSKFLEGIQIVPQEEQKQLLEESLKIIGHYKEMLKWEN